MLGMVRRVEARIVGAPGSACFLALALAVAFCVIESARMGTACAQDSDPDDLPMLIGSGEYELAEEIIVERLEKDGGDVALLRALGEVFMARGRYREALDRLGQHDAAKRDASVLSIAGQIHERQGRLQDAETAFRAAVASSPKYIEALNRLALVLKRTGRLDEAKALWNRIVAIYEELSVEEAERLPAEAYVEMGVALRELNRYHDANEVMFPQARDQNDESLLLLVEWARTYMDKYDYPFARDLLRRALDINRSYADARVLMAENYLIDFQVGTQRYELAEKQLTQALETNPSHAGAYAALGALWLSDGDLDRAISEFQKALEIDAVHPDALAQLAACYHLKGGAEADFAGVEKRMLEINPKAAAFYHTIALAIERRFRYHAAAEFSARALELDPGYWPAFHTIGINYLRTGREAEGREYLQKSYDNDPFNIWVVNTRKLLRHIDKNHREHKTEKFHFRFPAEDFTVLRSLLVPLMEEAHDKLSKHYGTILPTPIYVDVFSNHEWFSAKIVGLGGFPATGACFGNVVALTTPKALPQNWGVVAWHEFAHVVTLAVTGNRVPRWLTEGLSVYEEGRDRPVWARNFTREIADNYASGRLLPIGLLDSGFSKPKYPGQVLISYFQGCLVVDYITRTHGFDKVLAILAGYKEKLSTATIFRAVLSVSLEDFDKAFFAWLDEWVAANGYVGALGEEVVQRLEIEVEAKPTDAKLLAELAWAYLSTGNTIDAPLTAHKAAELDPTNGDAQAILGFASVQDKKLATARGQLEKALELDTRFRYRARVELGRIALEAGESGKALELFEEARAISPKAGAAQGGRNLYYQIADLYEKSGEVEKSIAVLEDLRAVAVEDARCRVTLAKHYLTKDDEASKRSAFRALDEVLYINPFDPALHRQLAKVASDLGEHAVVIREYGYLLELPDTNPKEAYIALAKAHLGLGAKDRAAEFAQKVLGIDDENEAALEILEKAK